MTYAIKRAVMFDLTCPKCDTGICEPVSGSFNWSVTEECPPTVQCPGCGATLTVPKGVK